MIITVFDTETTGLWQKQRAALHAGQPDIAQLGFITYDSETNNTLATFCAMLHGEHMKASHPDALLVHKITDEMRRAFGTDPIEALAVFYRALHVSDAVVAHNLEFDMNVVRVLAHRYDFHYTGSAIRRLCTMKALTPIMQLPFAGNRPQRTYKYPSLYEAYFHLYNKPPKTAHNALGDAMTTQAILQRMFTLNLLTNEPTHIREHEPSTD